MSSSEQRPGHGERKRKRWDPFHDIDKRPSGPPAPPGAAAPWPAGDGSLESELGCFADWVQPNAQETAARAELARELRSVCGAVWPGSTLRGYGSGPLGLAGFFSDLDLSLQGQAVPGAGEAATWLAKELRRAPWADQVKALPTARVPITTVRHTSGAEADICFGAGGSEFPKELVRKYPRSFRPVVLALKTLLWQHEAHKTWTGGIGSFKLYVMVAVALGKAADPHSAGSLLRAALQYWGREFDWEQHGAVRYEQQQARFEEAFDIWRCVDLLRNGLLQLETNGLAGMLEGPRLAEARAGQAAADRSATSSATEATKSRGNEAFTSKRFAAAWGWYTLALEQGQRGAIGPEHQAKLLSNRSAASLGLGALDAALRDAQACVQRLPQWAKGHTRRGAVLMAQGSTKQALQAYESALSCDPTDPLLKSALRKARSEALTRGKAAAATVDSVQAKAKGNKAFGKKWYAEAAGLYTLAMEQMPEDPLEAAKLKSNRSAAALGLTAHDLALSDAKDCVKLAPDWAKGYSRLGASLLASGDWQASIDAYNEGLLLDPTNEALASGLRLAVEQSP